MLVKFKKNVSKGSRFNQIYIPKNMENLIEVGDKVEVRLIKKYSRLYYSKDLKKLSRFKENLIKDIFLFLNEINYAYIFVVGSFLTEKINYNDIDIVLIVNKKYNNLEETAYNKIIEKFNLKFHILAIEENRFKHLIKICPLTRSMFSKFICNKPFAMEKEKLLDKNHIKFLLMMPQDLLEVEVSSGIFFDNIRRLITIERFLKNKRWGTETINNELRQLVNSRLYDKIRHNECIEKTSVDFLRKIIKTKLNIIGGLIKNGKK